jgi:hypothetical protein
MILANLYEKTVYGKENVSGSGSRNSLFWPGQRKSFPTRRQGLQSCGVRVIVRVLKKAVQTIRNDENTVRHRQHDLQKRRKAKQHDAKSNRKTV